MKTIVRISLAVLALGVFANAASAQSSGNVVWGALPANGVTIAGDFGMGLNDDAKLGGETSMYLGGRPLIGINVPSTGVAIKPWVLPRVQYVKITDLDGEIGFGASGGIEVNLPMGVGFHLGLDWNTTDFGGVSVKPLIVGAGVHYAIPMGGM